MKKRKTLLLTLFSIMLIILCFGVACEKNSTAEPTQVDYVHVSNLNAYGECDDFMSMDGELSEENWQNLNWFNNTFISNTGDNNMPSIAVTTFFTTKGVYIAAIITDIDMKYSGDMRPWNNTVIEFYYYVHTDGKAIPENTWIDSSKYFYSVIDLGGGLYGKSKSVMRGVTYEGEINTGNGKTATFELFMEWSEFGLEVETEEQIPEVFYLLPNARMALGGADSNTILCAPRNDMGKIVNYFRFNRYGYVNADIEESILGSNQFGSSMSGGWSINDCPEGIDATLSYGVDPQWIYFKESYDENFYVSVDIAAKGGTMSSISGWGGRYVGLSIMSPSGAFRNIQLDYKADNVIDTGEYLRVRDLKLVRDYSNARSWVVVDVDPVGEIENGADSDFYTLSVIKDGTELYYFVNGQYYAKENLSILDGKVFVALIDWNTVVEVKNCEYKAMTESETENLLSEKGFYTVTVSAGNGGTVSVNDRQYDKIFVSPAEDVKAEIFCKSNYGLSCVKWNGVELTDEQINNFVDGVYNFGKITENAVFEAEFAELTEKAVFKGFVHKGDSNVTADILLKNNDNPSIKYEIRAGRSSGFNVSVVCGTYSAYISSDNAANTCIVKDIDLSSADATVEKTFYVYAANNFVYNETEGTISSVSDTLVSGVSSIYLDENAGFIDAADGSFMLSYTAKADGCKYPCVGFTVIDKNGHSVQFYFGENRLQFGNSWSDICRPMNFSVTDVKYSIAEGAKVSLIYDEYREMFFMYAKDTLIYKVSVDDINAYIKKTTTKDAYKVGEYFKAGNFTIGIAAFQVEPGAVINPNNPLLTFGNLSASTDEEEILNILPDLCALGYHVDGDGDEMCDFCSAEKGVLSGSISVRDVTDADLSDTVLSFKYGETTQTFIDSVKSDGTFEVKLWQGTYTLTVTNERYNCSTRFAEVQVGSSTEPINLTIFPPVFSDEAKNATIEGSSVSIKGNGYAYLKGSDSAVYLKVTLNITHDHQGITIYTDSVNGNNAQIGFHTQGFSLLQDYGWNVTSTGNRYSHNGLLGFDTATTGEHTVEYFIIEGKLYVIYDGVNCFDKPLTLSDLNSAFTADATYHIGIYNFDGNYSLQDSVVVESRFGNEALQTFYCRGGTHKDEDNDGFCDDCGAVLEDKTK